MELIKKLTPNFIKQYIKRKYVLMKYGLKINRTVKVDLNTKLEKKIKVGNYANICNSFIGLGTYIGESSFLANAKVGRFCSIANNVRTNMGKHPVKKFVSTHPAFFSLKKQAGFTFVKEQLFDEHEYFNSEKKYVVEIGNDVWIGYDVTIMDGVKIGDGAIIGAKSLVTSDIEPYTINVGIPAQKIGYRFKKEIRDFLLDFKWWNKSFDWIKNNSGLFTDIELFYKKYKERS